MAVITKTNTPESVESSLASHAFPWASLQVRSSADLAERLGRLIAERNLSQGRVLPTERQMAAKLTLSRSTIRRALKSLESSGLVTCRQGSGYRVAGDSLPATSAPPSQSLASRMIAVISLESHLKPTVQAWDGIEAYVQYTLVESLREAGFHILTINPKTLIADGVAGLVASRPGAVVLTSRAVETHGPELVPALMEAQIPVVTNSSSPVVRGCIRRTHDHAAGARRLTELLIERGRRRILPLFFVNQPLSWQSMRVEGYRTAMKAAGLEPLDPIFVPASGVTAPAGGPEVMSRQCMGFLFDRLQGPACTSEPIDAVLAATDQVALSAAYAMVRLGIPLDQLPDITGYDHNVGWLESPEPIKNWHPLATLDKQNGLIGDAVSAAVRGLLDGSADTRSDAFIDQEVPFRVIGPNPTP